MKIKWNENTITFYESDDVDLTNLNVYVWMNEYVAYSSRGSHKGQLDFCNLQTDDSKTG